MPKYTILLLLTVCSVLMSGCAQYWYQEGVTYQQCLKDQRACFDELQKRTDFIGTGDYEFDFMAQCMREKGYTLVKEDQLPLDAKRAHPETSLHWRAKGIAGTVDE